MSRKPARWLIANVDSMPSAVRWRRENTAPALLTRTSIRGQVFSRSPASRRTACWSAKSQSSESTRHDGCSDLIRPTAVAVRSGLRPTITIRQPGSAAATWLAHSRPMPSLPPVIT